MTVWQTILLFYCALAGLFFVVHSPAQQLSERKATMSPEAYAEYLQQKNEFGLPRGCATSLVGMWEIAHLYFIEPAYVIWACAVPIEPHGLAYSALLLIVVRSLLLLAAFLVPFPKAHATRSWTSWVIRGIWHLPTLYLWFLLIVVIGWGR
ncbi:hypothetical protein KSF_107300 [Reticulibacter mediterranei]|uniref:Uncharacterized protein n=1 Tax=Reticulibacter mediterranei TaxID=2778369 RepID=A0A8J3NAR8_9CHLR|nr:hypothetical protein [Reticulibacter mediterranei]GHP00683.1 hypothetical protein KSF_107300 [Reticulibacter mediterranei]